MSVTVGVEVLDQDTNPVDGVAVEVFDGLGGFVTTGNTGDTSPGRVEFLLSGSDSGTVYNIKVYETATQSLFSPLVSFIDKKSIKVYEPVLPGVANDAFFEKNTVLSCSPNPNCCRLTAYFEKHSCLPLSGYVFYVRDRQIPRTVHSPTPGGIQGILLGGDRITLRTGPDGKALFDLPRNGIYNIFLPDYADEEIVIEVPDSPCWDLSDLLFLYPKSVSYDATTHAISVGDVVEVEVTQFLMSNGRERDIYDNLYQPVEFLDPNVTSGASSVEVTWKEGTDNVLQIRGLVAGSAVIQLVAKDPSASTLPVRLPKAPVLQTALSITVT